MSLKTADLGSVCVRARANRLNPNTPTNPPFISSTRAFAQESYGRACRWAVLGELTLEGPKDVYKMLQPWDSMSLIKADLVLVRVRAHAHLGSSNYFNKTNLYPLNNEPLHWRAKRDPKATCFFCSPFYGRACCWVDKIKT